MIFEEKKIKSEMIYEGKIMNVRRDTVTAKKGESTRRSWSTTVQSVCSPLRKTKSRW